MERKKLVRFMLADWFQVVALLVWLVFTFWFLFGNGVTTIRIIVDGIGPVWPTVILSMWSGALNRVVVRKPVHWHRDGRLIRLSGWKLACYSIIVFLLAGLLYSGLLWLMFWLKIIDWALPLVLALGGVWLLQSYLRQTVSLWRASVVIDDLQNHALAELISVAKIKSATPVNRVAIISTKKNRGLAMLWLFFDCLVVNERDLCHEEKEEIISGILHEFGHWHRRAWLRWEKALEIGSFAAVLFLLTFAFRYMSVDLTTANFDVIMIFAVAFCSWSFSGLAIVYHAMSRHEETEADLFAAQCGGSRGMISFLTEKDVTGSESEEWPMNYFAYLKLTHPLRRARIAFFKKWQLTNDC